MNVWEIGVLDLGSDAVVERNQCQNEREPRETSLQLDLQIVIKVLDDLGMSDAEIKRYFGNDGGLIAAIRNFARGQSGQIATRANSFSGKRNTSSSDEGLIARQSMSAFVSLSKAHVCGTSRREGTMKLTYEDVGNTKTARCVLVGGRKVRVHSQAIEIWKQNPEATFNAVWNADRREFRLSGPDE